MTGFTDRTAQGILNHLVGKTALYTLPTAYVGLFTAVGTDAGTGFTEVSGGGYARVTTAAGDWSAASGTGPSTISNTGMLTYPAASANWGSVIAFGLFDAASAGNLLAWDYFGNYAWLPAAVSAASPGVLTVPGHGFAAGDVVEWTLEYGGTGPSFSASSFTGALVVVSPAANTFTVTNGGTAVNTSAAGNGSIRKMVAQTVNSGAVVSFPAGSIVITAA